MFFYDFRFTPTFCCVVFCVLCLGNAIFIDYGNPYTDKPLKVGELTLTKTVQNIPIHTKVYFPQEVGLYPAVLFVPGLNGDVLAEVYETVLSRIASHGFFVFGLDNKFPIEQVKNRHNIQDKGNNLKEDINKFFQQYAWLQNYMTNKTVGSVAWNSTALLCHSSGCDITIKMIKEKPKMFTSTVFLEPFSLDIKEKVDVGIPAFMYGTELSEVGSTKCALPGFDYNKFYDIWSCPRLVMNVASFGHCDILDPLPWTACKDLHICTIARNTSRVPEYREFVQGAISSFLVSSLQGRQDAIKFITEKSLIPLQLLELKTDLNCTTSEL